MHIGRTRSVSGIAAFSTVCVRENLTGNHDAGKGLSCSGLGRRKLVQ